MSHSNFDSIEEFRDDFDPNYNPSSDHQLDPGADFLIWLHFEPMCI